MCIYIPAPVGGPVERKVARSHGRTCVARLRHVPEAACQALAPHSSSGTMDAVHADPRVEPTSGGCHQRVSRRHLVHSDKESSILASLGNWSLEIKVTGRPK